MSAVAPQGAAATGRTALITGGLGFIGSNLADRLARDGVAVIVFDNASRAGAERNRRWLAGRHGERVRVVIGDVRDAAAVAEAVRGVDVVYHLAAQVAVTHSVAQPLEDFQHNALGTVHVLEAARHAPVPPAVIYTSTNKVYGGLENAGIRETPTRYELVDHPDGIAEDHPLDFHSPYGCSKGAADGYVRDYARVYGLRTVVLRMSCICGPRQFGSEDQGWVAHFLRAALRGDPVTIYGDGKQVRDVLDVADLVEAFLAVTARVDRVAGHVFNIGGGVANAVSVWSELRELLPGLVPVPEVRFRPWRPADQRVYVSDIRKAAADLGWRPTISLAAALERLAAWVRELEHDAVRR